MAKLSINREKKSSELAGSISTPAGEVEVIKYVDRPIEVIKCIEVPVYKDREVIKYIEVAPRVEIREVEKIVYVDKPSTVFIDKEVIKEKPVIQYMDREIIKNIEIPKIVFQKVVPRWLYGVLAIESLIIVLLLVF